MLIWILVGLWVAETTQTHLKNFDTRSYRLKHEGNLRETTGRKTRSLKRLRYTVLHLSENVFREIYWKSVIFSYFFAKVAEAVGCSIKKVV